MLFLAQLISTDGRLALLMSDLKSSGAILGSLWATNRRIIGSVDLLIALALGQQDLLLTGPQEFGGFKLVQPLRKISMIFQFSGHPEHPELLQWPALASAERGFDSSDGSVEALQLGGLVPDGASATPFLDISWGYPDSLMV